jgi:hypothetical protein
MVFLLIGLAVGAGFLAHRTTTKSQLIVAALAAVAITGVVVAPGSAQSTARTDMVRTARGANAFGIPAARRKRVPNEVGKNHQAAQDDLQAHGFYNLRERDCSGRGRLLLFDRNWKVVRQSPRAGARVSTNAAVTLCSVKYSD